MSAARSALGLCLLLASCTGELDSRAPDLVILISVDTLRADHLGCYGYPRETSPALDSFAADAVLFRQTIAQAASTKPSHASLFTSLLVEHHGAFAGFEHRLADRFVTLAEALQGQGFRTISFNGGGFVKASWGLAQGFELYETTRGWQEVALQRGIDWLERHPDEKAFLFLHTYRVHAPYSPPPRYARLFDQGYDGPVPDTVSVEFLDSVRRGEVELSAGDVQHVVDLYDAELRLVDDTFGEFLRDLERLGRYDRALIVVTSDHGEEFGEHGFVGRHSHSLYGELLRVPLIVRLPGGSWSGTVVDEVVRSIDVAPTILDELGLPPEQQFLGQSLLPTLVAASPPERTAAAQLETRQYSLRTRRWKLIDDALFDLRSDPRELDDVATEHPETHARLRSTMEGLLQLREPAVDELADPDEATLEQLRALGY